MESHTGRLDTFALPVNLSTLGFDYVAGEFVLVVTLDLAVF